MKQKPVLLLAFLFPLATIANVRLPSVISSNMVLQQQSQAKLWGWASPAEKILITTSWNNKTDTVIATRDANWVHVVETPAAGGPYTITFKAGNTIVLENILIGEVWVCSGQSNMEWTYSYGGLKHMNEEFAAAANPNIRFFHVPKATSAYPQDDVANARWLQCDSNSLKSFSAVAYYFGKNLNKNLNIPIGLISTSWSGTPTEVWSPAEAIESNEVLKQSAKTMGAANWWPYLPGKAFNGMIAPLTNFAIAGAIWYQGEGNTGNYRTYAQAFTTMIDAWRKSWGKEFPFYYVQIAPFKYDHPLVGSMIQEQQVKALEHKNTGMVVITDLVDDTNNIHPGNKRDVGLRLANYALAQTYGKNGFAYKSPLYKGMAISKGKAVVQFDNAPNGLMSKEKTVSEIYVAGADKVFYPAQASIEKDKLIVWSKQVKDPVAVRYAFHNTAIGNLFSKEGLPVSPFRTDDW